MTAIARIKEYLSHTPTGKPFPASALRQFGTTENIRQILSRLIKAGVLKRVARGVFVKPEHINKVGEVLPSASQIAQALAQSTGEIIAIHGAEAARQLQLTTQVPMQLVFYTSGNTRTLKFANRMVRLKHVNPSRLIASGTVPGLVISALGYLGRGNVNIKTIEMIKNRITVKEFKETVALMERMPSWMSNIFYHYQQKVKNE
jgi:hypothetical protein